MQKFVYVILLASLAPTVAAAQTASAPHGFDITVSQQGAIGQNGFVDLGNVSVSLRTRLALRDANVYTSIYSLGPSGRTLIVTLGCHYGPLSVGQTATYRGISCDMSTSIPYAANTAWEADSVVLYTAATDALRSRLQVTPTPR